MGDNTDLVLSQAAPLRCYKVVTGVCLVDLSPGLLGEECAVGQNLLQCRSNYFPSFCFLKTCSFALFPSSLHCDSLLLYSSLLHFLYSSFTEHSIYWSYHPITSLLAWELKQVPTLVFKALTLQAPGFLLFPAPEALSSTHKSGDPHIDFPETFAWESLLGISTQQGPCLTFLGSLDTACSYRCGHAMDLDLSPHFAYY